MSPGSFDRHSTGFGFPVVESSKLRDGKCVVAGSNHQAEADNRPLHACPVCARKLHSAIGFDPGAREEALAKVLREVGIDDEATWSERRAKWIRDGTH